MKNNDCPKILIAGGHSCGKAALIGQLKNITVVVVDGPPMPATRSAIYEIPAFKHPATPLADVVLPSHIKKSLNIQS